MCVTNTSFPKRFLSNSFKKSTPTLVPFRFHVGNGVVLLKLTCSRYVSSERECVSPVSPKRLVPVPRDQAVIFLLPYLASREMSSPRFLVYFVTLGVHGSLLPTYLPIVHFYVPRFEVRWISGDPRWKRNSKF